MHLKTASNTLIAEYTTVARKYQTFVDFLLQQIIIREILFDTDNSVLYNLSAVADQLWNYSMYSSTTPTVTDFPRKTCGLNVMIALLPNF